ncbi:hybrid sensor histidine kinase/response regulator [Methanohalophilus halophilus]|nr:response regulator [Methanohalophilus halophilus]APH38715.1 hypothetical protein BHR79_03895 [Methanohalophilus halophilus]SDX02567.1 hypothetical protein SAMN04515625_2097 [Methanohalophilus halophilus]
MLQKKQLEILMVDDRPEDIDIIERMLQAEYTITKANSGIDSLEIMEKITPDVILLDIELNDISGHEICRIIKQRQDTRAIPLIIVTAINDREEKIRAFNNGADDFVLKPVDEFILKSRIETLLKVKGLQEQIRQERDLALKYIDTAGSIMIILDRHMNIKLANQKTAKVLGYETSVLMEKNWIDSFVPAEEKIKVKKQFKRLLEEEKGIPEYLENHIINRKGENRLIRWRQTVLRDEKGEVGEIVVAGEDVTAQKETEEQLKRANEELKTIDQVKKEFIANTSHELRTPMISLKGFSDLLSKERLGELGSEQKKAMESISRNSIFLHRLIESLFYADDTARDNIRYSFSPLDINKFLKEILQDISIQIREKGITIDTCFDDKICEISGSYNYLRRVFLHLLDNAIRFCPADSTISITTLKRGENIDICIEYVRELPDKIEDSTSTLENMDDAGIRICREIIDTHKGELKITESESLTQIIVKLSSNQN